ncbi:MAG: type IV pilus modification PilV family protein, partial [Pseudomonadota bacterium]
MADSRSSRPSQRQSGVTLIEMVITMVIVSVAIAGVVGGYSLVVGRSADTLYQSRTTALGQAYLDEILA